jgi:hypothetical protein
MLTGALKILHQLHPFDLREGLNCKVHFVCARLCFFMTATAAAASLNLHEGLVFKLHCICESVCSFMPAEALKLQLLQP